MNRIITTVLLATSAALASPAFADDIRPTEPFVSTADRAQVRAELAQARTAPNPWSIAYDQLGTFESTLTREEVRADYIAHRDDVAALTAEDSGAFALDQQQADAQVAEIRGDAGAN